MVAVLSFAALAQDLSSLKQTKVGSWIIQIKMSNFAKIKSSILMLILAALIFTLLYKKYSI
jgi:hypothetical protein